MKVGEKKTWADVIWGPVPPVEWNDWRWQWRHRITSLDALASAVSLLPSEKDRYQAVLDRYPLAVTPYYASLIDTDDPDDPLKRQCFPDLRELDEEELSAEDPLDERGAMKTPGLIHRYPNRAVALVTGDCALYCRHCTRKNLWRQVGGAGSRAYLQRIVETVAHTPEIREVIVSGGDPLLLELSTLNGFLGSLRAIRHVEVLRIGTRIPVVLPMRITPDLCDCLASHRPIWINTQFNHPREITAESAQACDRLLKAGLPVSNQAVLLRGVNDSFEVMADLCQGLQRIMVRPYYVFQCDPVKGVGHFRTPLAAGITLAGQLRRRLSGLSMPQFVMDMPGHVGKLPLQPSPIVSLTEREVILRTDDGRMLRYPNP